jgi:radical SAM superfamily enzyme YgiQ (UPF0313 family)
MTDAKHSRWNRYRVWKPLSLLVLAGVTPPEWEVSVLDENLGIPDYAALPRPDLVGITAFTSQANRAYEVAAQFRHLGVPVVMGGIHATMCVDEALDRADTIVTGEAEGIWPQVLSDAQHGRLQRRYDGGFADFDNIPLPRHDLLATGYAFGAIQTTRGCPLNCNFCSVSAFNGTLYRQRPISEVVREFQTIREKLVLIVDDNLIGMRTEHITRAKDLFRAMIRADLRKEWIAQATINFADDEELLALAAEAGCRGVFIGFESISPEGLAELGKKFNLTRGRDFRASVQRIQRHKMLVAGSFIIGLDVDKPGIGKRIARAASHYGVDYLNALFLTPLPGTRLWDQLESQDRIALNTFPDDWGYYTLTFPVIRHKHMSLGGIVQEMASCNRRFYSMPRILRRVSKSVLHWRMPLISLVGNLSYRHNSVLDGVVHASFQREQADRQVPVAQEA